MAKSAKRRWRKPRCEQCGAPLVPHAIDGKPICPNRCDLADKEETIVRPVFDAFDDYQQFEARDYSEVL